MKMQAEVIREGELEKRSDSLFQLWKKKLVVLTKDSLSLFPDGHKRAKGKELGFGSILKVDCVERTGKYIYFTIVTKDRKEIDFRCPDQSCWNASITMALIDFQNKRAIQDFKSRQGTSSKVSTCFEWRSFASDYLLFMRGKEDSTLTGGVKHNLNYL
ncbi:pleckstrin homology-like domain family A member 2 isoform X1 [Athene noctua]|uniref:pleckstrin homology-like domain family A member 2 isoform X1 n=1 Tax=Athene noctua TaxID=126797 RepID=UPI003EBAFC46